MIYPIVAYGDPVLRKIGTPVSIDYPALKEVIANMFETMYESQGVGLAAPQIGKAINLFIIDSSRFEDEKYPDVKKVFINAEIIEETGDKWDFEEGCLSIPHIRENVKRHSKLTIKYQDENFENKEETYDGIVARIIQHEYDHIKGILFVDRLSELKKRLIKNKLINISKGAVNVDYKMKFPQTR
ncbi:MAG: peptide deformylase [Bacteroidia bacterium]|nr:peptide deformylase [Bacteroidia bacterium]MBP9688039.1 peptide deformylase [Bacteroidia bacterium]